MALQKDGSLTIERVSFSVYDKTGIDKLAEALLAANPNVEMFGTSGSQKALIAAGIGNAGSITELTGNTESDYFDHRMATISFKYESALLADREKPEHMQQLEELGIIPIDLVVCNLYPFEKAVAGDPCMATAIENIDVGGPCMVRAAAKNWPGVIILTDPVQYSVFIAELKDTGAISRETRHRLATYAFELTEDYDRLIARFFRRDYERTLRTK